MHRFESVFLDYVYTYTCTYIHTMTTRARIPACVQISSVHHTFTDTRIQINMKTYTFIDTYDVEFLWSNWCPHLLHTRRIIAYIYASTQTYMSMHQYAHKQIYIYIYIYMYVYIYIYTYIHTYMHTYIHAVPSGTIA